MVRINMGHKLAKYLKDDENSSTSSDGSEESEEFSESSSEDVVEKRAKEIWASSLENIADLSMDAAVNNLSSNVSGQLKILSMDEIPLIENNLNNYEFVSLLFLLLQNPHHALLTLNGPRANVLGYWAQHECEIGVKWQDKLIEALHIIQNFKLLKKLGFSKIELGQRFSKYPLVVLDLNKTRKVLYYICEQLNREKTEEFLDLVRRDFSRLNKKFKDFPSKGLECYFLYWETIGYITTDNLDNIAKIFKQMDLPILQELCNNITPVQNHFYPITDDNIIATPNNDDNLNNNNNNSSNRIVANRYNSQTDRYFIDKDKPGVVLIINQQSFFTEFAEEYQYLLPDTTTKLEERDGSEKDEQKLVETFKKLNFDVKVERNLVHTKLVETIENVVKEVTTESSLFVCILSHGEEGVIFGSNSCKVDVEEIKTIMCSKNRKNLKGKPKVLFLQSCQGIQCQRLPNNDDEELSMDGPTSNGEHPVTADLLVFWATVPGFGAIRNKTTGTWFIQTLCEKILELCNEKHLLDICTVVTNEISQKIWKQTANKIVVMNPVIHTTLRKSIYFPKITN